MDLIFILMIFTLGGGVLHAAWNLQATRKLREEGENPYRLPGIYQQRRSGSMSAAN